MAMPKASMDQDDGAMPREDHIGLSGKVATMKAKAEPDGMQRASNI